MKAAVWVAVEKIKLVERDIPTLRNYEVLVKSRAVGVCGTDIHIFTGQYPGLNPPRVLGHEACGEIAKIGSDVTNVDIGDRVVVDPILWCGTCSFCKKGQYNLCTLNGGKRLIGYSQDGAYAEFFASPATNLHRITGNISFEEAALVDTLACPINAISKIKFNLNETVIVIGAGSAGLLFIQLAKLKGAQTIVVVEPNEFRRNTSTKMGADHVFDPSRSDFIETIKHFLPEDEIIVIEAAGTSESARLSLELASKQSTVVQYGYVSDSFVDGFDLGKVVLQELRVVGSVGYTAWNYKEALSLIESNRINVKPLITHTFNLEQIHEAFQLVHMQHDNVIKAVISQ